MTNFSGLRVLLVEDNIATRRAIGVLLRGMGFQSVEEAADGVAAYGLLQPDKNMIVLTDINMPDMNGFGLLQAIKADDGLKHVPVLMMTLDPRGEDYAYAEACGAAGLIAKPFSSEALEAFIRKILEGSTTAV